MSDSTYRAGYIRGQKNKGTAESFFSISTGRDTEDARRGYRDGQRDRQREQARKDYKRSKR